MLDRRARFRALALLIGALAGSSGTAAERRTVTFVMGEDSTPSSAFFAAGERYYQDRRKGEDLLVTQARSWSEIREWLARSKARGTQPWGSVVVIAHGSQWTGASVPVFPGERELRASELDRLIASRVFPALSQDVLDERSLLRVESCGVGRRPDLLSRYVQLLTGRANGMHAEASEQLVEFGYSAAQAEPSWRRERGYSVSVRPGRPLSAVEMQRLTAEGSRVIPAEMTLGLSDAECTIPLRRLVQLTSVQTTLSDFGMRAGEFEWSVDRRPDRTCLLSGHAQVISSTAQQIGAIGSR